MYVRVKLISGYQKSLWYKVPERLVSRIQSKNCIISVPLRNVVVSALVINTSQTLPPKSSFHLKEIADIVRFPADVTYMPFIEAISYQYQLQQTFLVQRIQHFLQKKDADSVVQHNQDSSSRGYCPSALTDEQQSVVDFVLPYIIRSSYKATLLHGVTGSGKTEVYKSLIMQAIEKGKSVVLLLPEVTLAVAFEHRLKKELSSRIPIFGFHSGKTITEKRMLWQSLLEEKASLIIGVHLPVLLPIPNIGLIIVDEEHDIGYQEKRLPKIHTKQAALLRAKIANIPILLGSATPSIASLYNAKIGKSSFFQLKKRFAGSFPVVKHVLLRAAERRASFWISKELERLIADQLIQKKQTIIFINRRGFSFFVQCSGCGFIFSCSHCSVSLTYHEGDVLSCHYCNTKKPLLRCCPSCKKSGDQFIKKGVGTQQIVSILKKMFPHAIIARADVDSSKKKKQWAQIMSDFEEKKIDILVGTQTIAKGFHFPQVTLVGIIWADSNLHFPLFNSTETTLQQLVQVAGRAGRCHAKSTVVIQSMAEHPAFDYTNEKDYLRFYADEYRKRKALSYPPCAYLVALEMRNVQEAAIDREAQLLVDALHAYKIKHEYVVDILGPTKPPIHKVKNIHQRAIYIKGRNFDHVIKLYQCINKTQLTSTIAFVPDPVAM